MDMTMREILFYSFSFLMIGAGSGVVLNKNPVKSALFLVLFFLGLAFTYAFLGAEFMATLQVLVYVGAIMVLFLFVIMLIAVRETAFENLGSNVGRGMIIVALVVAFGLQFWALLGGFIGKEDAAQWQVDTATPYEETVEASTDLVIKGNAEVISYTLFKKYLLPFELISLVLLVAAMGAVLLTKKNREKLQ